MQKILKSLTALIAISFLITGCIKEKYKIDYDEANLKRPIVEITESPTNKIIVKSVNLSSTIVEVDLGEIRISPRSEGASSVTVTLAKGNAALIATAVAALGTPTTPAPVINPIPNNAWNLVKTSYTLSDGSRVDRIKINITAALLPVTGRNALAVTVASATGAEVSGLYNNLIVELKPQSPYEGTYAATGTRTNYGGPTVAGGVTATSTISGTKFLATVSPNQVDGFMGDLAFVPFYYTLQVNTTTNAVTVLQSIANPLDTPPTAGNNGSCTYNPTTKTFTLNYFYLNGAGNLRQLTETLVKQ